MSDMDLYEKAFTLLHEDFDYIHDPEVMKRGIDNIRKQTMPYAIGNHLLALNMEDNDEPYRYLPEMMADMNKVCDDIEFVQESMDDYMDTIRKVMKPEDMYVHHGELRYTTMEYGNFNSLYGATHSSLHKAQKILNDKCENYLVNQAEPLASFASFYGKEYPRTNIDRAWEYLLKCHAHDSICGAAVDRAHDDMLLQLLGCPDRCRRGYQPQRNGSLQSDRHLQDLRGHRSRHYRLQHHALPPQGGRSAGHRHPKGTPKGKAFAGIAGQSMADEFYDIFDKDGNKFLNIPSFPATRSQWASSVKWTPRPTASALREEEFFLPSTFPAFGYATHAMRFRGPEFVYEPQIGDNRKLIARDCGVLENEKSQGCYSSQRHLCHYQQKRP